MIRNVIVSLAAALTCLAMPAKAQETEESSYDLISRNAEQAGSYTLDLSVPEAPALALLGLDSAAAAAPQDSRAFAADLANFVNDEGQLRTGGAITTQPFWWGLRDITLDEYQGVAGADNNEGLTYLQRATFARTRVSLGAAQDPQSDEAVRAAIALSFQLLDSQDPRMEGARVSRRESGGETLRSCLRERAAEYEPISRDATNEAYNEIVVAFREAERARLRTETGRDPTDADLAREIAPHIQRLNQQVVERTAAIVEAKSETYVQNLEQCYENWRDRQAGAPSWVLAIGQAYVSEDGGFDNLSSEGISLWSSYRQGLDFGLNEEMDSSYTIYGRYTESERIAQDAGGIEEADSFVAAVSLNVARRDAWEARLEAAWVDRDFQNDAIDDENYTQLSGSLAYRFSDTMWLKAAYGSRSEEDEFVRVSIVFAGGEGGGPVASALRALARR